MVEELPEDNGFCWLGLDGLLAGALDGLVYPFLFGPGLVTLDVARICVEGFPPALVIVLELSFLEYELNPGALLVIILEILYRIIITW